MKSENNTFTAQTAPEQFLLDENAELRMELDCAKNRKSDEIRNLEQQLSAMTAERNKLAEQVRIAQEQEPVTLFGCFENMKLQYICLGADRAKSFVDINPAKRLSTNFSVLQSLPKLYAHPPIQQPAQIPEGWQIVPKEPTFDMCCVDFGKFVSIDTAKVIYEQMLSAAPKPPKD